MYGDNHPYIVFDLETTTRSPVGFPATPHWKGNDVVMAGYMPSGSGVCTSDNVDGILSLMHSVRESPYYVVAHNAKFDISYLMRDSSGYLTAERLLDDNFMLWDTQLVEYIISAQVTNMASLDDLAVAAGGTLKNDKIKEYWEAGVPTEDIPKNELREYLEGDVVNTHLVYQHQMARINTSPIRDQLYRMIETQMRALKATIIAEMEGMAVDRTYIGERLVELDAELRVIKATLETFGIENPSSNKELSLYFFGGEVDVVEKEQVGFYKNGKPKFKSVIKKETLLGRVSAALVGTTMGKSGYYKVDDEVLTILQASYVPGVADVAENVAAHRELSKQKETYFEGLNSAVFPDGKVHPNINHALTKTGRLSCSKPNLQNQTSAGGIKNCFISRHGDEGSIVEVDFSQLEVVGLAVLSGDKRLKQDITDGVDIHTELYRAVYGKSPTKAERKAFKPLTFGLIYGAGVNTLAKNAGVDKAVAKKFVLEFYARYPQVLMYHENIIDIAKENRHVTPEHDPVSKLPIGVYIHQLPTGRMFAFREYNSDYKPGTMSFSPTELKNWPIQGFATGDVVPAVMGKLVQQIYKYTCRTAFTITVHDSFVFDVHQSELNDVKGIIRHVLGNTRNIVRECYGFDPGMKFGFEISVGPNWGNTEEI